MIKKLLTIYSNWFDKYINNYTLMLIFLIISMYSFYLWKTGTPYYLFFNSVIWYYIMCLSFCLMLVMLFFVIVDLVRKKIKRKLI